MAALSTLAAVALGVSATGTAANAIQASGARKDQKQAARESEAAAREQADQADQANNRANSKKPNMSAIAANNAADVANGTLLTGSQGVDLTKLQLGKNTLLGM